MKKRILLGTTNQAKIDIIQAALKALPVEALTLNDLGITINVKEDGNSTQENAEKKARAYFAASGIPTLAIDGGLHIAKLPPERQPGIFVRRIYGANQDATDEEVLDHYIRELDKVGGESEGAWSGSIVLVISEEKIFFASLSLRIILTTKRKGGMTPGSPLDAVTVDPATGKHYSEINWQERADVKWVFEFLRQHISEL